MNVTVKEFISCYMDANKDALSKKVYVNVLSKPDSYSGWYNDEPWMYDDAMVRYWHIEEDKEGKVDRMGNRIVTLYIDAKDI